MYLVRETGTYYKEYVVDGPPEKIVSLVGSSASRELAQGLVLCSKLEYKVTQIDESKKLDFAIRQAMLNLSSEQLEPIKPTKTKSSEVKPKQKRETLTADKLAELLED